MSERAMSVRCIYCGTDKPPVRNESELKDIEPWRCSECETSGTTHDFYLLEGYKEGFAPTPDKPTVNQFRLEPLDLNKAEEELAAIFETAKEKWIQEGIKRERDAVVKYFKRIGKPYYVALFREGGHLK